MKHQCSAPNRDTLKGDALLLGVFAGAGQKPRSLGLSELDRWMEAARSACPDFKGQAGRILSFPFTSDLPVKSVIWIGLGSPTDFNQRLFRKFLQSALKSAAARGPKRVVILLDSFVEEGSFGGEKGKSLWKTLGRTAAIASAEALYRFDSYKGKKKPDPANGANGEEESASSKLESVAWLVKKAADLHAFEEGAASGRVIGNAQSLAKDLMNTPPNDLYPAAFADRVRHALKGIAGIKVEVWDEKELERREIGGLIAVGRGSARPPRMVKIEYTPTAGARRKMPHLALVGKGITFDSGGISIKPSASMDEMKFDMCGAAALFGVTIAAAQLRLPARLTTFLALAENMPGSRAQRPGDIIRICDGQTVAVLNTDAEGRLILADALVLASREKPDRILDMATLTGACVIALGDQACGLLGQNEEWINAIRDVGERIGERAWPLPLYKEYHEAIKYHIADIKNTGKRGAGTITAAAFLQKFVDAKIPWAHLDIAGTAWIEGDRSMATGFGVWLVTELVEGARS